MMLRNISESTGGVTNTIATLTSFNPSSSSTSSNNLLAYRPNFNDHHTSGLAAFFVNMNGVYPCLAGPTGNVPICKLFTYEEDGFRNGRAVIDAADGGNNFAIFGGNNLATFGFAISGCATMNNACFPVSTEYSIVCLLPRSRCG